jgi:fibronectin type 3 domain-containing protein
MAARRKGRWLAIGGATAAIAIGAWSAVASATPSNVLVAPTVTGLAPHLTWDDDSTADGYTVQRSKGDCASLNAVGTPAVKSFDDSTLQPGPSSPDDATYCYRVIGHYGNDPANDAPSPGTAMVRYDTTPPSAQITFNPPISGPVRGNVPVTASGSDGDFPMASTTLSIDGGPTIATGVTSAPLVWNTTSGSVPDGSYTLRATATDAAGNSSSTTASVTVDNSPPPAPVISQQAPAAGNPFVSWLPVAGASSYTISRGGAPVASVMAPPWSDPDPATAVPGTYTYTVTAVDLAGNSAQSLPVSFIVIPPSATAPRAFSATSPTNTVPHLLWQPPVTFAVTSWQVYRDGSPVASLPAATGSFDDTSLTTQGPHTYTVQALQGSTPGDMSSPISVTFDTVSPILGTATAVANPDGSIGINWPDASDPAPGSGIGSYIVRRGTIAPADASSGTPVCTLAAPATGCTDNTAKNGTSYGYAVFAVDAAGNFARREASAKGVDTQPPDPVADLKVLSFDFSYARLGWDAPALKGANADLAGYRVILLRPGAKAPLNPNDGTVVCTVTILTTPKCDALNLTKGKKVYFAVYAFDEVPNYSTPAVISMTPHSIDHTPPHKPTKVKLTHSGLTYSMSWVSPRDLDLSKFRVTLYERKPPSRPSLGKAVVTGRVLHATFTLKPGRKVYVTLWALDVSGNFSRVTKLVVAPGKAVAKSKHKVAKKKTVAKKTAAAKKKTRPKKEKPISVSIGNG